MRYPINFRPTPSRLLVIVCGFHIIPRPQGVGGAGDKDDSKQPSAII